MKSAASRRASIAATIGDGNRDPLSVADRSSSSTEPKQGAGRRRRQFAVERSESDGATLTGRDARRALRSDRLHRIGQLTDQYDSC